MRVKEGDHERLTEGSEALIYLVMVRLMVRRWVYSRGFSDGF